MQSFWNRPPLPSGVVGSPEFQEEEGASTKRTKVLASVRWWPRKRIFGCFISSAC
jgi:hypothetical protein